MEFEYTEEQKEIDFQNELIRRKNNSLDKEFKKVCKVELKGYDELIDKEKRAIDHFNYQLRNVKEFMAAYNIEEDKLKKEHNNIYIFRFKVQVGLDKHKKELAKWEKKRYQKEQEIREKIYGIC